MIQLRCSRIFRVRTVETVLDAHKGIAPGFDLLRLTLALLILNGHAGAVLKGFLTVDNQAHNARNLLYGAPWTSWREPIYLWLVPMFFALSGFLIAGSAFRLRSVRAFLAFRVLRIVPALAIEVALSALVLGPIFTKLALADYFTDRHFLLYFGNIFGFVSFTLPGVFEGHPVPGIVNANLWTLPSEFYCYLITAAAMACTAFYSRKLYTILFFVTTIVFVPITYLHEYNHVRGNLPIAIIIYCFFCGIFFFHWRPHIPTSLTLLAAAAGLCYLLIAFGENVVLAALVLTYLTVSIGMVRWPWLPLVHQGDYSYGIYLYGFPISQALYAAYPAFAEMPFVFRILLFAMTAAFAASSWHFLEKPALGLKRWLSPRADVAIRDGRNLTLASAQLSAKPLIRLGLERMRPSDLHR